METKKDFDKFLDQAAETTSKWPKEKQTTLDMKDDKKTFLRVSLFYGEQDQGGFIIDQREFVDLSILTDLTKNEMSDNESYRLIPVELTQEEFDNLHEFQGW